MLQHDDAVYVSIEVPNGDQLSDVLEVIIAQVVGCFDIRALGVFP